MKIYSTNIVFCVLLKPQRPRLKVEANVELTEVTEPLIAATCRLQKHL